MAKRKYRYTGSAPVVIPLVTGERLEAGLDPEVQPGEVIETDLVLSSPLLVPPGKEK